MDYTNKTWGIGIVECWKNGFNRNKNELYHVVASFLPNIPIFHYSIIPDAGQIQASSTPCIFNKL